MLSVKDAQELLALQSGLLQPLKRGCPAIYENDEERLAALKNQKAACNKRRLERVKVARALLKEITRSTGEANFAAP
jgi:hypothetical protein